MAQSKVALITGGRRVGQAVAEVLARDGANIVLTYRSAVGELQELKQLLETGMGVQVMLVKADVTKDNDVRTLMNKIDRNFGRLDIAVCMASRFQKAPFMTMTRREFDEQIAADLTSTFLVAQTAAPLMAKNKWGRIVTFTDWVAASGRPSYTKEGYLAYYVAKTGVKALTEALALELAATGITVNAIAPGPILPPDDLPVTEVNDIAKRTPLGRWGGAQVIAETVRFLCQEDSYITGETIRVDGGRHLS